MFLPTFQTTLFHYKCTVCIYALPESNFPQAVGKCWLNAGSTGKWKKIELGGAKQLYWKLMAGDVI